MKAMKLFYTVSTALIVIGCVLLLKFTYNQLSELRFAYYEDSSLCNCGAGAKNKLLSTSEQESSKQRLGSQVFVQPPMQKIQAKGKLRSTFILIMVPILFFSVESRDLIRSTWYKGFKDSEDVMLRYVMGVKGLSDSQMNKLHAENKMHGDLVFLNNFTEGIMALTNKTMAIMKWATENVDFTYLIKCDDDTFLYVNNTIRELRRRLTTKRLYYGVMMYNHRPIHNSHSRWKDFSWNISKRYTPFARGGCYILSEDLVHLLVRQHHHLRWHHLEDVAVGLWLAPFDYERRNDDLMCYDRDPDACGRDDQRVAHLISVKPNKKVKEKFKTLWKEMINMQMLYRI